MLLLAAHVAIAKPVSEQARVWADDIWTAAIEGDADNLEALLAEPAAEGVDPDARTDFLEAVSLWQSHEEADRTHAEERREEARAEMMAAYGEGDLLESLRLLLEVQMLSESLDEPLQTSECQNIIADADAQIQSWRAEGKLFHAQQGLLRLRAVFEDVGNREMWDRLTDQYESLADTMQMMRRYRFEDYHQRYLEFHQDRGNEVKAEYNPRLKTRWKEEVSGVDVQQAARSIQLAMQEHVEAEGLVPLLRGGISAVRTLALDDMLSETFERLGDEDARTMWIAALDATEASLEVPGANISLPRTLQRIANANLETIQLPETVLWREFTDGAMEELDRFSQVIWPYDYEGFQRQMRGKFVGVGVQIQETDLGEIKVVTPLEGKPAFYAGVRADDIIATVDGDSTAGWTVQDAVRHITGPEDTQVMLGVRREGVDELIDIPVIRAVIRMPTVKGWEKQGVDDLGREDWHWMIDDDEGIGYIKLTGFDQETHRDLERAMQEMRDGRALNGLVLDLRFNPGGLLDLAGYVSNLFVPRGDIVTGEDRDGNQTFQISARSHACMLGGLPTVVLINRGSASASEIVAGCLQAHEAAVILGERSFGKGSVQTVHPVGPESRLKITNQYYRLPSPDGLAAGRLVHKRPGAEDWGVDPNLIVRMSADDIITSERLRLRSEQAVSSLPIPELPENDEDEEVNLADLGPPDIERLIADGFDPQIELALLLVRSQILAEMGGEGWNDRPQVAGGDATDLRSRAGGR